MQKSILVNISNTIRNVYTLQFCTVQKRALSYNLCAILNYYISQLLIAFKCELIYPFDAVWNLIYFIWLSSGILNKGLAVLGKKNPVN